MWLCTQPWSVFSCSPLCCIIISTHETHWGLSRSKAIKGPWTWMSCLAVLWERLTAEKWRTGDSVLNVSVWSLCYLGGPGWVRVIVHVREKTTVLWNFNHQRVKCGEWTVLEVVKLASNTKKVCNNKTKAWKLFFTLRKRGLLIVMLINTAV